MTSYAGLRDLPLRKGRINDAPRAYVGPRGVVLCDQSNKVCHLLEADAVRAGNKYNNPSIRAYRHSCGYWHVGHRVAA